MAQELISQGVALLPAEEFFDSESHPLAANRSAMVSLAPWIGFALLLIVELDLFRFNTRVMATRNHWWTALLAIENKRVVLFAAVCIGVFSWQTAVDLRREAALDFSRGRLLRWFPIHFAALALYGALGWLGIRVGAVESAYGGIWFVLFAASGLALFATWLTIVMPLRSWMTWFLRSRMAIVAGLVAGLAAFRAGDLVRAMWSPILWEPVREFTFRTAAALLRLVGENVAVDPAQHLIRTSKFGVKIAYPCSGLEGVGLIWVLVAFYFWSCRRELRFPHVLLLLPIATIAMFTLNAVRIAALVLIGGWRRDIALSGFHTATGWLYLDAVALGLVLVSRRVRFFTRDAAELPASKVSDEAAFLLLPPPPLWPEL